MDRKKELKEFYKQMKPDMGVFIIYSKISNKYYLEATQNLKGVMNSTKFKLNAGNFKNEELQKEWNKFSSDNFEIKILEKLEYDKDELKEDYREELDIMQLVWGEKVKKDGFISY